VDGFIWFSPAFVMRTPIGLGDFLFVKNGLGNDVFFRCPSAEIQQAAALRAEGKFGGGCGIGWGFAGGAVVFHGEKGVLPQGTRERSEENLQRGHS
jgi:hypothetical protein